jgi:hypothetical protein
MKNSLISLSVVLVFVIPQVSAESLFDKIKRKADEIIAEQEAKADQKIDQTIDETVDSAEEAVYEGGGTTTSNTSAGKSASTNQTAATGDNANAMLVKMTQTELKRLGYSVSVDGVYGTGTRNAILAYEADNGRQLSGNVSPDLINALKNSPKPSSVVTTPENNSGTTAAYQASNSTTTGAASSDKAMRLYNECLERKKKKDQASPAFTGCTSACYTPAFRTVVDGGLQRCEEEHKKAFQHAAELADAGTRPLPEKPPEAASDDAAWLATSVTEARQKLVECQGKIDADGDFKGYGKQCVKHCRRVIDYFDKRPASEVKRRFQFCLEIHKRWMET